MVVSGDLRLLTWVGWNGAVRSTCAFLCETCVRSVRWRFPASLRPLVL